MPEPLIPPTLRKHESFREDMRRLMRLTSEQLDAVLDALRDDSEQPDVEADLSDAVSLLRFSSARAAREGIESAAALNELQALAGELDLTAEFEEQRERLATAFSAERIEEELAQRDLALNVQYAGSNFQVIAITPTSSTGGAVAGLHFILHLHDQDGDSQTVVVILTQSQAEGLGRALTRGIAELRSVREAGTVRISNRLPSAEMGGRGS